ncbi:hypothetical protein [Streptomyces sparsogenes]|uniref:Uncharacterized protein n=1 Tax=Streptomyces sparsogenes DSM 40356 TaxID=1331668 RepID=A0A1R1SAN8_9ACTN|nr:hypothetical protein [Streptomyces sparsogenes]OMI35292.1 hypothetical protein SPAR_31501 [Streptomyces sparsogenes DSM 40356]
MRPHHRVRDPTVACVAVFCAVGRIDAVQERGQRSRLEGRSVAFGQFVEQGADPVQPKVAWA